MNFSLGNFSGCFSKTRSDKSEYSRSNFARKDLDAEYVGDPVGFVLCGRARGVILEGLNGVICGESGEGDGWEEMSGGKERGVKIWRQEMLEILTVRLWGRFEQGLLG